MPSTLVAFADEIDGSDDATNDDAAVFDDEDDRDASSPSNDKMST